jgi:hypothetical protein
MPGLNSPRPSCFRWYGPRCMCQHQSGRRFGPGCIPWTVILPPEPPSSTLWTARFNSADHRQKRLFQGQQQLNLPSAESPGGGRTAVEAGPVLPAGDSGIRSSRGVKRCEADQDRLQSPCTADNQCRRHSSWQGGVESCWLRSLCEPLFFFGLHGFAVCMPVVLFLPNGVCLPS